MRQLTRNSCQFGKRVNDMYNAVFCTTTLTWSSLWAIVSSLRWRLAFAVGLPNGESEYIQKGVAMDDERLKQGVS